MKNICVFILAMVFLSCKKDDGDLTSMNRTDGATPIVFPLVGSVQNPSFSPDDASIIFTNFTGGYNEEPADIYQYNLSTGQLNLWVSDGSGNVNLPGSSWNNDKIVFSSSREPHDEIYVMDTNGQSGSEIQVTNRIDKVAYEPTLSPDGEWIVFESHPLDVEGDGVITKYKLDGSSSYIDLTAAVNDCRQPNWSPAGDKILYQRFHDGQWNIWIMNTDGTDPYQVTTNLGNCTDASFTGDGSHIVFSSDFQVNIANIFKVGIDGTDPIQLTHFDGYDGAVSISHDGTKLIFETFHGDPDGSAGTQLNVLAL